jgi:putative transposase
MARVVLAGMPHHVTLRGNNRRRLFSYPKDYRRFVSFLARALLTTRVRVHAATLMPNHVHLVVTPNDVAALPRFVQQLSQRYAQDRNKRTGGSGKLFEQRYFSRPILDERQLAVTVAYVELNPVRAGIVSSPADYRWSTYPCHASDQRGEIPASLCAPTDWYLELGTTDEDRRNHYAAFVAGCRSRDERPVEASELEIRAAMTTLASRRRLERPDGSSAQ